LLQLIGMVLAGTLGDVLGVLPVLNAQGCIYVAAGLLTFVLLVGNDHSGRRPPEDGDKGDPGMSRRDGEYSESARG
jgi:hypothetical protein